MRANPGNPQYGPEMDSIEDLKTRVSSQRQENPNPPGPQNPNSRLSQYNPYSNDQPNIYESVKTATERETEQMRRLGQSGAHHEVGQQQNGMLRLGNAAFNSYEKPGEQYQRPSYEVYNDKTSVPLSLNPNQVQNIEDRYLARRGFETQTNHHQTSSNPGQNSQRLPNQAQDQNSQYNKAQTNQSTANLSYNDYKAQAAIPVDNPMKFYKQAQKAGGLDKFSNVSSEGNPLNTVSPQMMEYYSRINKQMVEQNPYKTFGKKGGQARGAANNFGGGRSQQDAGGMSNGRGGVAFNL